MPDIKDWATNPLAVIDSLFENDCTIDGPTVIEHFLQRFRADEQAFQRIPSLNSVELHDVQTGSLVRFRCMVQDMYDPEFFLGAYTVENTRTGLRQYRTGMFRDVLDCESSADIDFLSENNRTMDRQTLYCVPIPGEAAWVKELLLDQLDAPNDIYVYQKNTLKSDQMASDVRSTVAVKRTRESDDNILSSDVNRDDILSSNSIAAMETSSALVNGKNDCDDGDVKRIRHDNSGGPSSTSATSPDLNFPLPCEKGPACLVKVYDLKSDDIKLNDVIEVTGVLSCDPVIATFTKSESSQLNEQDIALQSMEFAEEHSVHNPPPSLVPRLHVIHFRKLLHNNPHIPQIPLETDGSATANLALARDQLLAVLEKALFGDRLAAEYLLCHLVSSIYARHNIIALGKFSLNLMRCPPNYPRHLYELLARLVTKSHFLPMSLDNMNSIKCTPRKDYVANRLQSGVLQLSSGTHLVLDETVLESGRLDATGVANITALGNVINWQRLDYDFNFHQQPFDTDIITLVMSEGKSLLKCDCILPVVNDSDAVRTEEIFNGIDAYLIPAFLDQIRVYITVVKSTPYSITEPIQGLIEEDFVTMRREDPQNLSVDDFHTLLTLARLLSLTLGRANLTMETWAAAKMMEMDRKHRLEVVGQLLSHPSTDEI